MSEETENTINEALIRMVDGVEQAGDFLAQEVPEVIGQLLRWHAVESGIYTALFVAVLAFYIWANLKQARWLRRRKWSYLDSVELPLMFGNLIGQPAAIALLCILWDLRWLQIWIAPKLYLVEYAATLAR